MSAPAQVTEAHRALVKSCMNIQHPAVFNSAAQLIADSEAKAVEQANAQVESLLSAAKNAIPASEHPAEPTVENWAWQMRNLGEDRRLVYAERDQLRAEVERLGRATTNGQVNWMQESERQQARAERAEAELKSEQDNSVLAEAELAESRNAEMLARVQLGNERARLDELISVNATGAARLAHATAQLAAEREKVRVLRAELTNIAAAKPAHWGDEMDQFMPWAQSRARHTLAATEDTP